MGYGIKGGRGPKLDPLAGRESLADRAEASQVRLQPLWFSSVDPASDLSASVLIDTTARWFLMPQLAAQTRVVSARIEVTVAGASASDTAVCQLFHWDLDAKKLKPIPASYVAFEAASTGQKTATIRSPLILQPNQRLVLYCYSAAAGGIRIAGRPAGTYQAFVPSFTGGGAPDTASDFSELTPTYTAATPAVTYLTAQGAENL